MAKTGAGLGFWGLAVLLALVCAPAPLCAEDAPAWRLGHVQRVAWLVNETHEAAPLKDHPGLTVWRAGLEALGLRFLSESRQLSLLAACPAPPADGSLCAGFTPRDTDLVISGGLKSRADSADKGFVGARVEVALFLFRADSGERIGHMTLEGYGQGAESATAYQAALARLTEPVLHGLGQALRLSYTKGITATLTIDGFSSREEQDDFTLVLSHLAGVNDLTSVDEKHDRLTLSLRVSDDSLNGLCERAAARIGVGLVPKTIAPGRIEARYDLARALHLPVLVAQWSGAPRPAPGSGLDDLERLLRERDRLDLARLATRPEGPRQAALKEAAAQYGPCLVVFPEMKGERIELTLMSSFAGPVAQVSMPTAAGAAPTFTRALVDDLLAPFPAWLLAHRGALRGLRARQAAAYAKTNP